MTQVQAPAKKILIFMNRLTLEERDGIQEYRAFFTLVDEDHISAGLDLSRAFKDAGRSLKGNQGARLDKKAIQERIDRLRVSDPDGLALRELQKALVQILTHEAQHATKPLAEHALKTRNMN
jgi:hypothetical protein